VNYFPPSYQPTTLTYVEHQFKSFGQNTQKRFRTAFNGFHLAEEMSNTYNASSLYYQSINWKTQLNPSEACIV